MRSLSAFNLTKIDNPYVDSINLIEIELSGLTLYLCDRVFGTGSTECVFNGQRHEPIIVSVGESSHGALEPVNYTSGAGRFSFAINNTMSIGPVTCFTKLFLLYTFYFATVTQYQIYEGASASGDLITKFKGSIEDFSDLTQEIVEVTCSGPELPLDDTFAHDIVDQAAYPGADPDDVGKMLPQVYGSAKRVPFISIDAGSVTTLVSDIGIGTTTLILTDSTLFPSSGTIQIDLEQITYTGNAGNQLTGCSRGQNSTIAVEHVAGAKVAEIQSNYWYIIGHAVKAINAVYVDDVRQTGNYNAYTGQTGDNDPSGLYDGKACIRFNTLPIIKKQVNVYVEDTIDVDTDTGSHDHAATYDEVKSWMFDSIVETSGFILNKNWIVGDDVTIGGDMYVGSRATISKILGESLGGYGPISVRFGLIILGISSDTYVVFSEPGLGSVGGSTAGTYSSAWIPYTGSWSQFIAKNWAIVCGSNFPPIGWPLATVHVFAQVKIDNTTAENPATGVLATKTGDAEIAAYSNSVAEAVIGALVSVDLDGYQDDGSGTYGTPNALIERPDHILKHVLINRCGKSVADIDSTTYAASGTTYGTEGYELAPVLLEPPNVRQLLFDIAMQARSIEFWEGGTHHLVYIPDVDVADKVIDSRIDLDSISIKLVNRRSIKNRMSATYDKYWSGKSDIESEQAIVKSYSTDSIAKYGTLEADRMSFAYITNEAQALDVIGWVQSNRKDVVLLLSFVCGHHLMEIEKGDTVSFDFEDGDQLDQAFLGLISTVAIFKVLDVIYQGNDSILLTLETGTGGLTSTFGKVGFSHVGYIYYSSQSVILSSAVVDTDVYYTTDGSDPTTDSNLYSSPILISQNTTIKARSYRGVMASSGIQTEDYEFKSYRPVISPNGGTFSEATDVTITCATSGVTIRYTTDNSEPNSNSTEYTVPISLATSATTTIRAKAFKSGWTASDTAGAVFIVTVTSEDVYAWYNGLKVLKKWDTDSWVQVAAEPPNFVGYDDYQLFCANVSDHPVIPDGWTIIAVAYVNTRIMISYLDVNEDWQQVADISVDSFASLSNQTMIYNDTTKRLMYGRTIDDEQVPVGDQLIASWTNNDYPTFTSEGPNITYASTVSGTKTAQTASIPVEDGASYRITYNLTYHNGQHFKLSGLPGGFEYTLAAGINVLNFSASGSSMILTVKNTLAGTNICSFTMYKMEATNDVSIHYWDGTTTGNVNIGSGYSGCGTWSEPYNMLVFYRAYDNRTAYHFDGVALTAFGTWTGDDELDVKITAPGFFGGLGSSYSDDIYHIMCKADVGDSFNFSTNGTYYPSIESSLYWNFFYSMVSSDGLRALTLDYISGQPGSTFYYLDYDFIADNSIFTVQTNTLVEGPTRESGSYKFFWKT